MPIYNECTRYRTYDAAGKCIQSEKNTKSSLKDQTDKNTENNAEISQITLQKQYFRMMLCRGAKQEQKFSHTSYFHSKIQIRGCRHAISAPEVGRVVHKRKGVHNGTEPTPTTQKIARKMSGTRNGRVMRPYMEIPPHIQEW